jgi:hypothetical protein
MSPKKKIKHSGSDLVGGPSTSTLSRADAGSINVALEGWLNHVFGMTRNTASSLPVDQLRPSPVLHGGTFIEIVARSWEDPLQLMRQSYDLMRRAGVIPDGMDIETCGKKYFQLKVVV